MSDQNKPQGIMTAQEFMTSHESTHGILVYMQQYAEYFHNANMQQVNYESQWTWDDYEKNDPTGYKLKELRASDPKRYKKLFDNKFGYRTAL
jgi:hypothetical protein